MKAKTNHVNQKPTSKPNTEKLLTFSDHIKELRGRLMWVVAIFLLVSALAYNYRDWLVDVILAPLDHQKLVYLTPGGGFAFIFQVTLYAAMVVIAPVIVYHLFNFLKPALPHHAKKSTLKVVAFASILMSAGVAFGYFIAVPAALKFLANFAGTDVLPNLTADSYLTFFLSYVAGLGVLFQLPLLLLLWHWINPFTPSGLLKSERIVVLFSFVAAAIITPTPDVFNQAMIAGPLILIYQLGVVAVLISLRRRRRQAARQVAAVRADDTAVQAPVMTHQTQAAAIVSKPKPVASLQSQPLPSAKRVSMDGFSTLPRHTPTVPVRRPLAPKDRPVPYISRNLAPAPPSNPRPSRSMRSIDGMSPLNP